MNGIEEPLETAIKMSVELIFERHPIAFYELVQVCRDPDHKLFGNTGEILEAYSLLQEGTSRPHTAVKEVVLANTKGEGLNMEWMG